jgi:hypothetical protein
MWPSVRSQGRSVPLPVRSISRTRRSPQARNRLVNQLGSIVREGVCLLQRHVQSNIVHHCCSPSLRGHIRMASVTVEHVHVHAGGQAVVGTIQTPRGVGITRNQRINPMQTKLPMHLSRRCGARTRSGSRCQSPAMPNGRCRMHGGLSPGAPKGNKNALKHGRYTAEAIAGRRQIAELVRAMKALARNH